MIKTCKRTFDDIDELNNTAKKIKLPLNINKRKSDQVENVFVTKESCDISDKKLYTSQEVLALIKEREGKLVMEYNKILYERLYQQYQNFLQYNEDYLTRKIKTNEPDYIS